MGCAETENPPFPDGVITLEALNGACTTYDAVESYTRAVDSFRRARGIDVEVDESHERVDLRAEQQVKDLVALFLNSWQCRLPNPDSKYVKPENRPVVRTRFETMKDGLRDWCERCAESLPSVTLRLAIADDRDIDGCLELFEWLSDVKVTEESADKRQYYGDVAASKTLYILRPHFFVPWDNDIQKALRYGGGCGRLYVRYLKRVRGRLNELDEEYMESGVPGSGLDRLLKKEIPGQESCTPVELLNKYYWASVPRDKS